MMLTAAISLLIVAPQYPGAWMVNLSPDGRVVERSLLDFGKERVISKGIHAALPPPPGKFLTSAMIRGDGSILQLFQSRQGEAEYLFQSKGNPMSVGQPKLEANWRFHGPAQYMTNVTLDNHGMYSASRPLLKSPWYEWALCRMGKSGNWTTIKGVRFWRPGRKPGELFLADGTGKTLTKIVLFNEESNRASTLTAMQFRALLWPAAKVAYDKFGPMRFFQSGVDRPGYPTDPAYVVGGINPQQTGQRDNWSEEFGSTAIILKAGKVHLKPYRGTPIIATKMVGNTMYVLSDDSIFAKSDGEKGNHVHLFKVDQKQGLMLVKTVSSGRGVSYAFTD